MSGCKHPLTNFSLLLLLFLLYCVYPIPFINIGSNFQLSKDFLIIETCGSVAMILTTIIGNFLCITVFKDVQNRAKFLYILMFIADALEPFVTLPARLRTNWDYYYTDLEHKQKNAQHYTNPPPLKHPESGDTLLMQGSERDSLIAWHSVWYGIVVVSFLLFTLICVLDFYVSVKQIKKHSISKQMKFIILFMVALISILLAHLYYYIQTNRKWNKGVALSVLSFFVPFTVCTLCLLLTHFIRTCCTNHIHNTEEDQTSSQRQPSARFAWVLWLSYVVCYTPFYTYMWQERLVDPEIIHATHGMTLIKPCCNVFILIEFDRKAKQQLRDALLNASKGITEFVCNECYCCCFLHIVGYCSRRRDKFRAVLSANGENLFVMDTERGGLVCNQNGSGDLLTSRSDSAV